MDWVVDDVPTTFSASEWSHRTAWARYEAALAAGRLATRDLPPADESGWAVSHPMELSGDVFNLYSGYTEEVRERLWRWARWGGERRSLGRPLPDYTITVAKRGPEPELEAALRLAAQGTATTSHYDLLGRPWSLPSVTFGDSHAVAHASVAGLCLRRDGLTLVGLLRRGLLEELTTALREAVGAKQTWLPGVGTLRLVAGSVDLRHHVLRQPNPKQAVVDLTAELGRQATAVLDAGLCGSVELVAPMPVEHEGRRLPKTGWYKGTPFYGTAEARRELTLQWIGQLEDVAAVDSRLSVWQWPPEWYTMDGEAYAREHMERPGSVHIAPRHHRWRAERPSQAVADVAP